MLRAFLIWVGVAVIIAALSFLANSAFFTMLALAGV